MFGSCFEAYSLESDPASSSKINLEMCPCISFWMISPRLVCPFLVMCEVNQILLPDALNSEVLTKIKAPIKRCVIVDNSARAHFHPNYHQLPSTIMRAVKREKLSSTIITVLNMFKANDS